MSPTLLATEGLSVSISGVQVCRGLDLTIASGQCWGILGRNGVGKTTLIHTLAGLRQPASGRIWLQNRGLSRLTRREIARRVGVLLQTLADPFPITVQEAALLGRYPWLGFWQWEGKDDMARAQRALEAVDLIHLRQRLVSTLSGGERQRLAFATLLTQDPALFLLDEPVNHLDLRYQIKLLGLLLDRVHAGNRASVLVLHDINLAARFCDHLLLLFGNGSTLQGNREDVLNERNLQRLYEHPVLRVHTPLGDAYLAR
jgi:iron complex transport system ATP-binding protein